jgi:uncharacterized protein (TIGR02284 family)
MNKTTTTSSIASVLNELIETCKDGQQGFQHAAENVKNARLQQLFQRLALQRGKFATQLQNLVRSLGEKEETSSSVAGVIHRGWIDLRSAVSTNDEKAILAECERGEDSAVAEYRSALEADLPIDIRSLVVGQSAAVKSSHDEIKALRDSVS